MSEGTTGATPEDVRWMRRALQVAPRGWGRVAPNPMVGALVVKDGRLVGEGWHTEYGHPHAEVEALRAAGEEARGATAYVTLEPCTHWGKTPPCTHALISAGVRRVVFAAYDPNPRAAGGEEILREHGIEAVGGVLEPIARDVNPVFFHQHSPLADERPFVALKLAMSLDGRVADREGRSAWITGEEARNEVHRLRAGFEAVAVGVGTALADDPKLTVRGPVEPRVPPARVVFDRSLRLPEDGHLATTANETPVYAVARAPAPDERRLALEGRGVRVLSAPEGLDEALRVLRLAGIRSMFVEGGAGIASALLQAGLVDRLYLFYAPLFLGPEGLNPFAALDSPPIGEARRWRRVATAQFSDDTLVTLAPR
jgi:diaminohydroxyphosphoribosylaminopyrimidine deaminase/5-amino-6-(5-phosphoribosylamino)uracil reductase